MVAVLTKADSWKNILSGAQALTLHERALRSVTWIGVKIRMAAKSDR